MNVKINNEATFTTSGALTVYLVGLPFTSHCGSHVAFNNFPNNELLKYDKVYNGGMGNQPFACFINKLDALEFIGYRFEDRSWVDSCAHVARCVIPDNTEVKFGYLSTLECIGTPNVVITPRLKVVCIDNTIPEYEAYKTELKKITEGMPLVEPLFFEEE
jgi:hypothetical protein